MSDLGTLIYGYGSHGNSEGYGINASGQVTGRSQTGCNPGFCPPETAFVTYKDLPPGSALNMPIALSNGSSYGINDSGQLTGGIQTIYGFQSHAFITSSSGAFTDLGALNGGVYSTGYGINASGRVTGSWGYGASAHAFITDTNGIMSDLGTLSTGNSSIGYAINASGQVTGWANVANGNLHAFVSNSNGIMSDLGSLDGIGGSIGYGINDNGQVVGTSNAVNEMHAFVTENGSMKDLNSLMVASVTGWVLNEARGINNAGQIAGTGTYNGMSRAFVLTPVSAVPVPAAIWFFTTGLGLFAFNSRRKAQG
jgi:probable HAF family extracellular repeat protein